MRLASFPPANQLVMLIYGEFNIFRRDHAAEILDKAWQALEPGGTLLLEPHTESLVQQIGGEPPSWYASPGGLFSPQPHLVLQENFWDGDSQTATCRYYVIDAATAGVTRYAQIFQAYTDNDYRLLLHQHGFSGITFLPSVSEQDPQEGLFALLGYKRA